MHVHYMCADTYESQKRAWDYLEIQFQAVVSHLLLWVPATKP